MSLIRLSFRPVLGIMFPCFSVCFVHLKLSHTAAIFVSFTHEKYVCFCVVWTEYMPTVYSILWCHVRNVLLISNRTECPHLWPFKVVFFSKPSLSVHKPQCYFHLWGQSDTLNWLLILAVRALPFKQLASLLSKLLRCHVMLKQQHRKDTLCNIQNMGILARQSQGGTCTCTCTHMSEWFSLILHSPGGWICVQLWRSITNQIMVGYLQTVL